MLLRLPLALALLAALSARATDRIVSGSGLYPTIGDALAVSQDGDRILLEPGTYTEHLSVSKGITFLPNQEGTRPTIDGNITIDNADGKRVLILGIRCTGYMIKSGTYTTRTEVKMMDSRIDRLIDLRDPYIHVEMVRDTISCQISLSSGRVIGNEIPGCQAAGEGVAGVIVQGATNLPDDLWVIGNSIGGSAPGLGVSISSDSRFHVENNYVRGYPGYAAVAVQRPGVKPMPAICAVLNNTLFQTGSTNPVMGISCVPNLNARNNALITYAVQGGAFNPVVTLAAINSATGAPTAGSPLINAGDPDPRYLDLDLTRNDAGCHGGSNSRANFTTPMGSAVVGYMQAPRVVAQGEGVNISATGFDR
jgi:hypothetical protein